MTQPEYFRMGFILGIVMFLPAVVGAAQLPAPEDLLADVDTASLEQVISETLLPDMDLPNAEDWQLF